jgi:ATP-dependent Clp protease adaptor protein ClpS
MVILSFFLGSILVGGLLYLPFFLWFRRQRRRGLWGQASRLQVSRESQAASVVQVLVWLGGAVVAAQLPESPFGRLVNGPAGLFRWLLIVTIAISVVAMFRRDKLSASPCREPESATTGVTKVPRAEPLPPARGLLRLRAGDSLVVTLHPSFAFAGFAVAVVVGANLRESFGCWLACLLIYALHELGHAAAAQWRGLKVFAIDLSMMGGMCRTELTRSVADTGWVFATGLLTQFGLLLVALLAAAVAGAPESPFAHGVFLGFTVANGLIMAINLVPGRTEQGLKTDGTVLWALWRHVHAGAPHPLAEHHAASPLFPRDARLLEIDGMAPPGFRCGIEILNDDATPTEFVAGVLTRHVGLAQDAAVAAMLEIHSRGGKLFPTVDLAQAEVVAGAIAQAAREAGHRLACRAVCATGPQGPAQEVDPMSA